MVVLSLLCCFGLEIQICTVGMLLLQSAQSFKLLFVVGLLWRSLIAMDNKCFLTLFKALIRPKLEYINSVSVCGVQVRKKI